RPSRSGWFFLGGEDIMLPGNRASITCPTARWEAFSRAPDKISPRPVKDRQHAPAVIWAGWSFRKADRRSVWDRVLVVDHPGVERLEFGVEYAHRGQVAVADEGSLVLGVVLEHVAELHGSGPHLVEAHRPVRHRLADRVGDRDGIFGSSAVVTGDA